MTTIFADKPEFEKLRKTSKNLIKVDTDSEEFREEFSKNLWKFKCYKWTLIGVPNGVILQVLLPRRYPIILRSIPALGIVWMSVKYGHFGSANKCAIEDIKKRIIFDEYKKEGNKNIDKVKQLLYNE